MTTLTETPVKTAAVTYPAPGPWVLDTNHSSFEFTAQHLMVSKVHGRFTRFEATLDATDNPETTTATATIDAGSLSTSSDFRDKHLLSADFFELEKYPTITYRSTALRPRDATHFRLDGILTIRARTHPVALDVEYLGLQKNPQGKQVAIFEAVGAINREDWDLTWNLPLESGGMLIGKTVKLELNLQFIPQEATA